MENKDELLELIRKRNLMILEENELEKTRQDLREQLLMTDQQQQALRHKIEEINKVIYTRSLNL
jgi:cytochrome c-type biogenesis protein CcmH/NrfG